MCLMAHRIRLRIGWVRSYSICSAGLKTGHYKLRTVRTASTPIAGGAKDISPVRLP